VCTKHGAAVHRYSVLGLKMGRKETSKAVATVQVEAKMAAEETDPDSYGTPSSKFTHTNMLLSLVCPI